MSAIRGPNWELANWLLACSNYSAVEDVRHIRNLLFVWLEAKYFLVWSEHDRWNLIEQKVNHEHRK